MLATRSKEQISPRIYILWAPRSLVNILLTIIGYTTAEAMGFTILQTLTLAPYILLVLPVFWYLGRLILYYTSPLQDIPGPVLARFSRSWLLREVWRGTMFTTNRDLHLRYGPIVRIAPNEFSIEDPSAVKMIYGVGTGFVKGPWYQTAAIPHQPNIFSTSDSQYHAAVRRPIASAYSTSHLVQLEQFVDNCISLLRTRFSGFVGSQEYIDIGHWMQLFSLDAIGEISFGKRFGSIETGKDPQNLFSVLEEFLVYAARVGVYPELHSFLFKAKALLYPSAGDQAYIHKFAAAVAEARFDKVLSDDGISAMDSSSKLLAAHQANPDRVTKQDVIIGGIINVTAGTDTTSISLAAVIYHLWQNPRYLSKLRDELKGASDPITFEQAKGIPYLEAVIKEALRVHPAAGLPMQRVVPQGGRTIAGRFFPAGTIVGINPWAAHSNREVFGEDADVFNPERWLADPEIVKKRDAYFMTFGAGSRTCIGKNITHLEMIKLIPELVRNFDFEPEYSAPWKTMNVWFIKPVGWKCRIKALK
ncbi:hypothetical protein Vi05172_g6046 [Venturia inaequalis]|nr:hypothetical protein Vi05172_g6046 [Venturia inaequalis]